MSKELTRTVALLSALLVTGCAGARVARVPETRYTVFAIAQEVHRTRIAGAELTIGEQHCRTDRFGSCVLRVAPGTHALRMAARGYRTYDSKLTVVTDVMVRVPLLEAR